MVEKNLKAYKSKIKIRRIKSNNGAMYGRIQNSRKNRRLKFTADSGTGIFIIQVEIANEHELEIREVDPDEPGCESATGHDMEITGQTEMFVKMELLKKNTAL